MPQVPQRLPAGTTAAVSPVADRFRPTAAPVLPGSAAPCSDRRLPPATGISPAPISSRTLTTHCHPKTPTSPDCVVHYRTETHARSEAPTASGHAPIPTIPSILFPCPFPPLPNQSTTPP